MAQLLGTVGAEVKDARLFLHIYKKTAKRIVKMMTKGMTAARMAAVTGATIAPADFVYGALKPGFPPEDMQKESYES